MCGSLPTPIHRSTKILRFLITAAVGKPKQTIAVALLVLAALASTMTYTGYLAVGVLADYLGTSRFVAGLLLGVLFARFPKISNGKLRVVGLLPKPARRPLILGILGLCLATFLSRGDYVSAGFTGFAAVFLLAFPWLRRVVFDRIVGSVFKFTGRTPKKRSDDMVIDGEFRERKD
jgi:peptidoglycan/LPS O-acetylase OafA/YrhL